MEGKSDVFRVRLSGADAERLRAYVVEATIPQLSRLSTQGWEVVPMQPMLRDAQDDRSRSPAGEAETFGKMPVYVSPSHT